MKPEILSIVKDSNAKSDLKVNPMVGAQCEEGDSCFSQPCDNCYKRK